MRLPLWCYCALMAFIALLFPALVQAEVKHVVMISIDGLSPEVYLAPDQAGVTVPNLLKLRDEGASAKRMVPVFPSVTYPGHTSLVTGVYPATHGVVANYKRSGEWYFHATDIKSPTLWQAAAGKGLVTAIVTWPASSGARVDYLIPEMISSNADGALELIRSGSTPGLFASLENRFGPIELPPFEQADGADRLDQMSGKFAAGILRSYKPNLLLVHFLDADHQQHSYGPGSAEARHAFERIDLKVGDLIQAARDAGILATTTFVIVGDHGFLPVHTSINVDGFLADIGYGKNKKDGSPLSSEVWAEPFGGGAAFYLEDPGNSAFAEQFTAAVRIELGKRYAGMIDLISRDALNELQALPKALFALVAEEGYMFTSAPGEATRIPAKAKGMHGYLPTRPEMATGLIISGAGVRKGLSLQQVRMIDVAPTVAALLGIELNTATSSRICELFEQRPED